MFAYAANNPVHYIDPDGRKNEYYNYELNKSQQNRLLSKISRQESVYGWTSTFANIGSYVSNIPNPFTAITGNTLSIFSTASSLDAKEMKSLLDLYNATGFEAAKEYAKNTKGDFDKDCTLTLVFASVEREVSIMNEPTTVLKKFQDNPGKRLTPDDMVEIRCSYYVTLHWKDKDGKTLGGTTIELYKSTYDKMLKFTKELSND